MSIETSTNPEVDASEALYHIAVHYIQQTLDLLTSTVTEDEHLSFSSNLIPGSTIGKHLRHLHQHFLLLLSSLPSSSSAPTEPLSLSYDVRSRNLASETSHAAAVASFEDLKERLAEGRNVPSGLSVKLEAVTPVVVQVESSWAREVIAVGELHLSVPPDFGVAPSTLAFRDSSSTEKLVDPPKL
ncbi:hypothetical protein MNV49_002973 [Pseudohyphozyma bogoriensis]|nr:hypothetical protein MNV49_002973 [Pseudohyphozyma bogoriensis]